MLISPADFHAISASAPRSQFWEAFHRRFPGVGGFIVFGAPAFDADRRLALVYVEYTYGNLGGVGALVLLTRGTAGWQITQSASVWIS